MAIDYDDNVNDLAFETKATDKAESSLANSTPDTIFQKAVVLEVINDPDRFGTNYASRLIGALVPFSALQREIKKASTNELKQTAGYLGDARKNTLGFGDNLPTKRDFWGNVIPTKNNLFPKKVFFSGLSPIASTTDTSWPFFRTDAAR